LVNGYSNGHLLLRLRDVDYGMRLWDDEKVDLRWWTEERKKQREEETTRREDEQKE
jgi:hypothetical protein